KPATSMPRSFQCTSSLLVNMESCFFSRYPWIRLTLMITYFSLCASMLSREKFDGGAVKDKAKKKQLPREAYSVEELSRLIGVSKLTCWRRVRDGSVRGVTFGRRVLIPKEEVDRILGR